MLSHPSPLQDINVKDEEGQTPLHHASRFAPKGTALNPSLMFYVPRGPAVEDKDDDEEEEEEGEEKQEDTEEPVEEGEEQNNVIQVQPQVVVLVQINIMFCPERTED